MIGVSKFPKSLTSASTRLIQAPKHGTPNRVVSPRAITGYSTSNTQCYRPSCHCRSFIRSWSRRSASSPINIWAGRPCGSAQNRCPAIASWSDQFHPNDLEVRQRISPGPATRRSSSTVKYEINLPPPSLHREARRNLHSHEPWTQRTADRSSHGRIRQYNAHGHRGDLDSTMKRSRKGATVQNPALVSKSNET